MFTRVSLVTPHGQSIVSLSEVKRHLYISHDDEDTYLTSLAATATAMIDGPDGIGVSIAPATYRASFDRVGTCLEIGLGPVTEVVSVTVDGEVVDASTYRLEIDRTPQVIYFDNALLASEKDGVKVTFTAGYETAPADLKQAALLLVGHFYRYREATTEEKVTKLPMAVESILARYRG